MNDLSSEDIQCRPRLGSNKALQRTYVEEWTSRALLEPITEHEGDGNECGDGKCDEGVTMSNEVVHV